MNRCGYQQSAMAACGEMRGLSISVSDSVVCPKPRRIGVLNPSINDQVRPSRWHAHHQTEVSDSKAGMELLDIILTKMEDNIGNQDDIISCDDLPTERDVKRMDELTEKDVFEMTFDTEEDGERFYNTYAKVKGFSIRRAHLCRDKSNMVISRRWVCSKEGYRQAKYLEVEDRQRK